MKVSWVKIKDCVNRIELIWKAPSKRPLTFLTGWRVRGVCGRGESDWGQNQESWDSLGTKEMGLGTPRLAFTVPVPWLLDHSHLPLYPHLWYGPQERNSSMGRISGWDFSLLMSLVLQESMFLWTWAIGKVEKKLERWMQVEKPTISSFSQMMVL